MRHRGPALIRAAFSDWWSADDEARIADATDRLVDDLRVLNRPMTLIHGDPRSDNLLFPDGGGPPVFVDWGVPALANPAWDVSHLLSSSLEPSSAGAADDLITGYCRSLAGRGVDFDERRLRADVVAGWRAHGLFITLTVRILPDGSDYGEDGALYDLWMPRILELLRRAEPSPS